MSHAAALLLPLGAPVGAPGVPAAPGRDVRRDVVAEAPQAREREDDAWAEPDATGPVWSVPWYQPVAGGAHGDVYVAVGYDDGHVDIFARPVSRAADTPAHSPALPLSPSPAPSPAPAPSSPGGAASPASGTRTPMTRKWHRSKLQMYMSGLAPPSDDTAPRSAPRSAASQVLHGATAALTGAYASRSPTVGVSSASAAYTPDDTLAHVEGKLEAQAHAYDKAHGHHAADSEPYAAARGAPPSAEVASPGADPAPRRVSETAPPPLPTPRISAPGTPVEPALVWRHDDRPWACVRQLYTPDASPVAQITTSEAPSVPGAPLGGVLAVLQTSGRVTVWRRADLGLLGSVVAQVQLDDAPAPGAASAPVKDDAPPRARRVRRVVDDDAPPAHPPADKDAAPREPRLVVHRCGGDVADAVHVPLSTVSYAWPSPASQLPCLEGVRADGAAASMYLVLRWAREGLACVLWLDAVRGVAPAHLLRVPCDGDGVYAWHSAGADLLVLRAQRSGHISSVRYAMAAHNADAAAPSEPRDAAAPSEPRDAAAPSEPRDAAAPSEPRDTSRAAPSAAPWPLGLAAVAPPRHAACTEPPSVYRAPPPRDPGEPTPLAAPEGHASVWAALPSAGWAAVAGANDDGDRLWVLDMGGANACVSLPLPSAAVRVLEMPGRVGVECVSHTVTVRVLPDGAQLDAYVDDVQPLEPHALAAPLDDVLWPLGIEASSAPPPASPTALLPLSLTKMAVALPDGGLGWAGWDAVLAAPPRWPAAAPGSAAPWRDAALASLQLVTNPRTDTQYLLGGTQRGDVGVWSLATLRLEAAWSWCTAPIQAFVPLHGLPPSSPWYGCVVCVARDSTCAVLTLDDVRLSTMLPGTDTALSHVAVRGPLLWLVYGRVHTRCWDAAAMAQRVPAPPPDLAGEHVYVVPSAPLERRAAPAPGGVPRGMLLPSGVRQPGAASVLLADVRRAVAAATLTARHGAASRSLAAMLDQRAAPGARGTRPPLAALHGKLGAMLRPLLALLVPSSLDPLLRTDTPPAAALAGAAPQHGFLSMAASPDARFCVSPATTAQHLLSAVALLLLDDLVDGRAAPMLDALLSPSWVADVSGARYAPPSLEMWALYLLDENEVLRTAATRLWAAYAPLATTQDLAHAERLWAAAAQDGDAAVERHAVLYVGSLCAQRYAYFSPTLLKQLAAHVERYMAAPAPGTLDAYVALELCCTGFHVWQHYVDTVALVRHVFRYATAPDDVAPPVPLVGMTLRGLARRATLELATQHSALFMSTLAMDILHAPSVEQSDVTLRLVAFMVHHKPLALQPSLPRLVEAVVKSLDPSVAQVRSSLAPAAALMINELVQTYPTIAFHSAAQRLAVGTAEGPLILYDVRAATRLRVLQGHTHAVSACAFSPDGRTLLSLSVGEEAVRRWSLGTSVLDMFRRAPPDAAAAPPIHVPLGDAARRAADAPPPVALTWKDAHAADVVVGEAHFHLGGL